MLRDGRAYSSTAAALPTSFEFSTVAGVTWLLRERLLNGATDSIEELLPDLIEIIVEPYLSDGETPAAPIAQRRLGPPRSTAAESPGFTPHLGAA